MRVAEPEDMEEAARRIHLLGPRYVLVKGGHLKGDATDLLWNGREFTRFSAPADRFAEHPRHRLHLLGRHRGRPRARPGARRRDPDGQGLRDARRSARASRPGRGVGQLRHFIAEW